jgi:hypothetical protein
VDFGWLYWVIPVILAIAAIEVIVLLTLVRRRRRRQQAALDAGDLSVLGVAPARRIRRSASPRTMAIIFGSIGAGFLLVAGICTAVVASSISGDSFADGTVVALHGSGRVRPTVEFTTPGGATVQFTSWVSSSPPIAPVGGHVRVRYTPDNPQDAEIDAFWQIWFLPMLAALLGTPFVFLGFAFGLVASFQRSAAGTTSKSETSG